MKVLKTYVALVMGVGMFSARGDTVGRDGLPYVAGDCSIANQMMHGDAHVMALGTSVLLGPLSRIYENWKVDRWSGIVLGPNLAGGQFMIDNPSVDSQTFRDVYSPEGWAGIPTVTPGLQIENVFNGIAAPAQDSTPSVLANRFYELGLDPGLGAGTAWGNTSTGNLTLTPLVYANPNGAAAGTVSMSVRIGYNPIATLHLDNNVAATPTLFGPSLTIAAQTWTPGNYVTADFRINAGAAPAEGSNLTISGLRITNGQSGFQIVNDAHGGWLLEDYLNDAKEPLANVQQFVNLTDTNIMYIELGVTDFQHDTAATFKTNLKALMDRYRSTNPNMKFVLSATYDENQTQVTEADGTPRQLAFDRDMVELANSEPNVLFINMFDEAPDWATLNATWLSDGTHATLAGRDYFAALQWDLITQAAAAAAPEPTSPAVGFIFGSALFVRRRVRAAGLECARDEAAAQITP